MPGTSGVLSPYGKIDGLYFNSDNEPQELMFELMKEAEKKSKKNNSIYISFDTDDEDTCYSILDKLSKFTTSNLQFYGTSRTNRYETIIENDAELEEESDEEEASEDIDNTTED